MARGPLPNPQSRRTNAATIPSNTLPPTGRKGRAPALPATYKLQKAGRAWWNWAWKLPQATRWEKGDLYFVARRAQLEDDLVALEKADGFDVGDLVGDLRSKDDEREVGREIEFIIRKLKGLAGGRVGVMKEMRELDNRLGLNPKALADLRWVVEEDGAAEQPAARAPSKSKSKSKAKGKSKSSKANVAKLDDYRDRYS